MRFSEVLIFCTLPLMGNFSPFQPCRPAMLLQGMMQPSPCFPCGSTRQGSRSPNHESWGEGVDGRFDWRPPALETCYPVKRGMKSKFHWKSSPYQERLKSRILNIRTCPATPLRLPGVSRSGSATGKLRRLKRSKTPASHHRIYLCSRRKDQDFTGGPTAANPARSGAAGYLYFPPAVRTGGSPPNMKSRYEKEMNE